MPDENVQTKYYNEVTRGEECKSLGSNKIQMVARTYTTKELPELEHNGS